jgi:hypothetical protein
MKPMRRSAFRTLPVGIISALVLSGAVGCRGDGNKDVTGAQLPRCAQAQTMCNASADVDAGVDAANEASADAGAPYCADLQSDGTDCGCCGNACSPGQVCTEGRCAAGSSFSFFVFADMHVGPAGFNATTEIAMQQMHLIDSSAVLAVDNGDLVDTPSPSAWSAHDSFVATPGFQPRSNCPLSFGAETRYFATVGDHDTPVPFWYDLWSQHLLTQQRLGQSSSAGIYYALTYGNAFFVMLDSEHDSPEQTSWLQSTLVSQESQSAQLKFVFFHEPLYSCSSQHAPLAAALPWIDLAEQSNVNVVFGSHTHVYTRSCPKKQGSCGADGTGVVFVETGTVGALARPVDVTTTRSVTGVGAAGQARTDTYDCVVGQDLVAANSSQNDFCHVRVEGCQATVKCYAVADGNMTPFDTWTVSGCT